MEKTINAIKEKARLLEAYADVLSLLRDRERWYMHEDDDGILVDDEDEYSKAQLSAVRNTISAVKKLAGV